MALTNLWGSYFSRVGLNVGEGVTGAVVTPEGLRERVHLLLRAHAS
jgi:hypothetical protein